MRVLLDECVPRRFARELSGHDVRTVLEMGWSGVKNGRLLALASQQFDAFVTVDRNLQFQQHTASVPLMILVLAAAGNDLASLRPLVPALSAELDKLRTATVIMVAADEGSGSSR
ncbi:MAG: DUF5615 family PIN-like protein [Nevskia sp.]|jgi:hypothetical protein|nr:DUF5615 family PIN-like protein [Gammaproteobacteria bacterium]MDH4457141.1 DUF5615 family PIN-like protein [Nevskia sp.]